MPGSKLYITGDSQAVAAEIYIDGERVGVMEHRVYSGPPATDDELKARAEMQRRLGLASTSPVKPGEVFSEGVDLRVARGEKQAKYGVYDQVRVRPGPHEIAFVHTDGRRLVKRIDVRDEAYIGVSFAEMRITGGE